MTPRERLLKAASHEEPDRLPITPPNIIPTRQPFDEKVRRLLDEFPFDRLVGLNFVRSPGHRREVEPDLFEDGFGCRFRYKGVGSPYCVHHPLAFAETVKDVEDFNWPDPEEPGLIHEDAREKARKLREESPYATFVGMETIFHRYQWLRGFDRWLLDLKTNPDLHRAIADRIFHISITLTLRLLEEVGEFADIVVLGDDLGTSTAPFMSPEDFRLHIKPYIEKAVRAVKERFPHLKFYLHSHGQIMDLVPDLVECGVDILNPILPLDGMDPARLKRDFGDLLCFEGGVDVERILPFGTPKEVEEHVKEVVKILSPGGGYIFRVQAISPLIPYENLLAAYETAIEYGRYGR